MRCDHCGGRQRVQKVRSMHRRAVEVMSLCGPCRGEPRMAPAVHELPKVTKREKRTRDPRRWQAVDHLLGTVKDEDIATILRVSRNTVCNRRNRMGIARFDPRAVTDG